MLDQAAHDDSPTRPLSGPRRSSARRLATLLRTWAPSLLPAVTMLLVGRIGLTVPAPGPREALTAGSPAAIVEAGRGADAVLVPYQLFLHYWSLLAGETVFTLRAPSLIAMALAAGFTGELGRRLLTPGAGLFAGLLLVALPATSRYAQEAGPHALALCAATAATLLLYLALDRPGALRWLGYGLALAVAGLAHPVTLLVLAGHTYTVVSRWRLSRVRSLFWWFPVTLLALVAPAPLISLGVRQHTGLFLYRPGTPWELLRSAPEAFFGAAAAGLLVAGLALAARWPDPALLRELAVLGVLPPVALLAASFLTGPLWAPRHVLFALPAVLLLAAAAMHGLRLRAVVALVLVAVLGLPQQQALRQPGSHLVGASRAAAT
ncbi:glycosyltransferase family 39 protein [Actinoplanes sp. NPDC049802]|uniref:glycosyltransferase family 39 protein n=1 Tax=Actinoplanes sp. NPDC049802 TaxID=3154742 RepID=UPI0033EDD226